jgi:uncharacterized membrane protein YkvA (DUF1232 family)
MPTEQIQDEQARKELNALASKIDEGEVVKLVQRSAELDQKLSGLPGAFGKFVNQTRLLFDMVRDYWNRSYRQVPWTSVAMAAAAILYFFNPMDLVPDVLPVIGMVDDVLIASLAIKALQRDLKSYCEFKGLNEQDYF